MQEQPSRWSEYRAFLSTYLASQGSRVALLAALLLISTSLQVAGPLVIGLFIDLARAGASSPELLRIGIGFLGVVVAGQLISVATTYYSESIGWTATNELRNDLAAHCLRLDLPFHQQHLPGELIERIDGDINALANFFSTFVLRVIGTILLLIGTLALLYSVDWRIGLALTLYTLLSALVLRQLQNVGVQPIREFRETSAELSSFWEEHLIGLEDIRSSGARDYVLHKMYRLMRTLQQRGVTSNLLSWVIVNTSILLFAFGNAIAFGLGAYLFALSLVSLGQIYALIRYTDILSTNLRTLMREMNDLQAATASLQRVQEIFTTPATIRDRPGSDLPAGPLSIHFEDVSFGYQPGVPVLHQVSFDLAPGKTLGLIGHTGSGKTSITRLLFRFYDPDQGSIRLNGIDLRDLRLHTLRQRIGLVMQDVQLFHATIRDNLTFFDRGIDDERIVAAIRELGLMPWYDRLAQGLDTVLAGSDSLSAGEAQLLALTRVFLKDPSIVIMDEASSRLDSATEQLIERAVAKLLTNRTAIIIAHRLHTVMRADEIMLLEHGRICERDQPERLLNDPSSHFFQLWQAGARELAS